MYKFSNGVVVFTEEDKEAFLKAGYVLVEEIKNEDNGNNRIVEEEPRRGKRFNSKIQK